MQDMLFWASCYGGLDMYSTMMMIRVEEVRWGLEDREIWRRKMRLKSWICTKQVPWDLG